jgi:hypothetical protein
MTSESDELERLLRERRVDPLADEGFTDKVLARLPARRARTARWATPVFTMIGVALAAPTLIDAPVVATLAALSRPPALYVVVIGATALVWATSVWALLTEPHRRF